MNEESINILGIADIIKREGGHRRSNSTGKFDTLDGGRRIFSRYLRPPIGSCHDFCKYGEERALEIKARGPISSSIRITETLGEGLDPEKSVISIERKKKLAISKQRSGSKTQKLENPTVKGAVSSSSFKGPKVKLKLSKQTSLPLLRYSNGEGDRKIIKIKDKEIFNFGAGLAHRVVSSPHKETYALLKRASDSKRKPSLSKLSKQFFLPIQIYSTGVGDRKARRSKDTGMSKLDDAAVDKVNSHLTKEETTKLNDAIVDGVVSSLTKEETVSPQLVSSPPKEMDDPVKHTRDPKRKSNLSKQSSLPVQIFSSGGGDRSSIKSKDVNFSMTSAQISSGRTKSKSNRSKEMRSSAKGDRKVAETSSVSLSAKLPLRRSSSWNVKNSRQLSEVSHFSNQKTIRKPKHDRRSSQDVIEKTLHVVGRNVVEKTPSPTRNDIPAINLSPPLSSSFPDDKVLNSVQSGIHTAQAAPLSANWNLKLTRKRRHAPRSHRSCPPSPKEKGSTATRIRTCIAQSDTSSLALLSTHSETDVENQISDLEKELECRRRKDVTISLKDESNPGHKLTFRRGKTVELQPYDSTLRRLKFRRRVLGNVENGINDDNAAQLFPFSMNHKIRRIQKRIYARRNRNKMYDTQSLPSWPSSPKEKALLEYTSSLAKWSTHSDASDHDETDTDKQIPDLEEELMNRWKKDETIRLKGECSPGKMPGFQSAKLVDLQREDSTPRRLKFRQRVLSDNQDGEGDADGANVNVSNTESEKVALRYQHVTKETTGNSNLYNNVIEETVSELVKTSKSKVKALVGAFENLISLQDNKPL